MEGNGPGYYRPPSLISLWTSAPFLHNNSVGPLLSETSVEARMTAFDAGIEQMLLLHPRSNVIWRTTEKSYISIPLDYIPRVLRDVIKVSDPESVDANGNLRIGPIPKGTPINLLSNLNLEGDPGKTGDAILQIVLALAEIRHLEHERRTGHGAADEGRAGVDGGEQVARLRRRQGPHVRYEAAGS